MVLGRHFALVAALATLVVANPIVERGSFSTHPIVKKPTKISAKDLLVKEKARIASFVGAASTGSAVVTNEDVTYTAATSEFRNM